MSPAAPHPIAYGWQAHKQLKLEKAMGCGAKQVT
jgi:hypothetical protein